MDRVGNHHVASGSSDAFSKAIGKTNPQNLPPRRNQRQQRLHRVRYEVSADHDGLAVRNLVGQVAGEKLGERSHTLGDAFYDPKLRCSGANGREKGGQDPVRHFAGRVVEERSQAECVYISGGRLGTRWWGRLHIRVQKIAWRSDANVACTMPGATSHIKIAAHFGKTRSSSNLGVRKICYDKSASNLTNRISRSRARSCYQRAVMVFGWHGHSVSARGRRRAAADGDQWPLRLFSRRTLLHRDQRSSRLGLCGLCSSGLAPPASQPFSVWGFAARDPVPASAR